MRKRLKKFLFLIVFAMCLNYNTALCANSSEITVEKKVADIDLTMSIRAYVMSVSGTIKCGDYAKVSISVSNKTDGTEIFGTSIIKADGTYNIDFSLPSLLSDKNYTCLINVYDTVNNKTLAVIDLIADTGGTISINGTSDFSENVKMTANITSNHTSIVNKSGTITGSKAYDYSILNVLSFASINVNADLYETKTVSEGTGYTVTIDGITDVNGIMTVSGRTNGGSGNQVTILVTDYADRIVYINQKASSENGNYSFIFKMPDDASNGIYTVNVGGEKVNTPVHENLIYSSNTDNENQTFLTVNAVNNKTFWVAVNDSCQSIGTTYTIVFDNTKLKLNEDNYIIGNLEFISKSPNSITVRSKRNSNYLITLGFIQFEGIDNGQAVISINSEN